MQVLFGIVWFYKDVTTEKSFQHRCQIHCTLSTVISINKSEKNLSLSLFLDTFYFPEMNWIFMFRLTCAEIQIVCVAMPDTSRLQKSTNNKYMYRFDQAYG